jgi:alginate O-acetyltransferase complex protein AlgI
MLFNSHGFLLGFLPLVLLVLAGVQLWAPRLTMVALVTLSLIFYGRWDSHYVILIVGSIVVNYAIGQRLAASPSKLLLAFAVTANLATIGWFKYYNFFVSGLLIAGIETLPLLEIVLPLGISFFTFQQISYLVDNYRGEISAHSFKDYIFVVTFFPHLIAGPIVRYSEIAPQLAAGRPRMSLSEMAPGAALLIIGLGKKVLLADPVSAYATPVFQAAAVGQQLSMLTAWQGALAYTFQIYFDFSGYSDMALGLALLVGIHLPINFNSPYKATSIIEFWRDWHMSLSRFLRDYLYIPLGGGRYGFLRRYVNVLVVMLLGGLWHGAGVTFLVWGLLHGFYLLLNHVYRDTLAPLLPSRLINGKVWMALSWLATFLAVVIAWVFFRASDHHAALAILKAMAGLAPVASDAVELAPMLLLFTALAAIVLGMPNSQTVVGIKGTVPENHEAHSHSSNREHDRWWKWRPSMRWAALSGIVFAAVLVSLSKPSPFLYFQF